MEMKHQILESLEEMNPWEGISLSDYEKHMGLESVRQLQALNEMMKA